MPLILFYTNSLNYESMIPPVTEVRVLGDADVDVQDADLQMLSNLGIKVLPDKGKDHS